MRGTFRVPWLLSQLHSPWDRLKSCPLPSATPWSSRHSPPPVLMLPVCKICDVGGNGVQLQSPQPSSEGLALHSSFPAMGWMTSPLTTLTSIPTLTGNPLELSDFLFQERLPLTAPALGLGSKSKGTEPTSSALAVGWLDLDRPVHLKGKKRRHCWGSPLKPPRRALPRPGAAEGLERVNPRP